MMIMVVMIQISTSELNLVHYPLNLLYLTSTSTANIMNMKRDEFYKHKYEKQSQWPSYF